MDILVVEDDEYKRAQIVEFLRDLLPDADVSEARSVQSAVRALSRRVFSLVLLDMSLPTFDVTYDEYGGRPQPLGGKEVLGELDRRELPTPVIVLTQFTKFDERDDPASDLTLAELDGDLSSEFSSNYRCAIYYDTSGSWRSALHDAISDLRHS